MPSRCAWRSPFLAVAVALLTGCGSEAPPRPTATAVPGAAQTQPGPELELVFPYGSEKKEWLEAVTAAFHQSGPQIGDKRIKVRLIPLGSGELMQEILAGRIQAHLASPASAAFIELANAESQTKSGGPVVGRTENLVMSPVVIAMWEPMAKALGWGKKPIGWAEILAMAKDPEGWKKYGYPQWGSLKFGHTHPEYSNSGLLALCAEVYAGAGKQRDLTRADLERPEVADFVREIELSVLHYGSSTGFFGKRMFEKGPGYLSAAVLYENMVIESRSPKYNLPFPIVAIYPREGTFWSDHPAGVVERPWVTPEHRAAAEQYLKFLTAEAQQRRALEFGFRPADPKVALGAPVDEAHGVNPQEPQTTLAVPSADISQRIIELWRKNKKHAHVALVLDTSGSMRGPKMTEAKVGAAELIKLLGADDRLSLGVFNQAVSWPMVGQPVGANREKALVHIESQFADGGTALYDALADALAKLQADRTPGVIKAIVVLSDGADEHSKTTLAQTLSKLQGENQADRVRVFTIGYGSGAAAIKHVLEQIAEASEARFTAGTPENIRQVFQELATFF